MPALVRWFIALLFLPIGAFSVSAEDRVPPPALSFSPAFQEWQIWEVKTGQPVAFEDVMANLVAQDVIYLGEEHHNQWHIEAALKVLGALLSHARSPILALEMFGWDGQAALDRYLTDQHHLRDQFLKESRWEQNWGGAFEDYEPLVAFARTQHLPVVALNPPKSLVRLVAKRGLTQALAEPDMADWGMKDERYPEDPAYYEMITRPLRQCHGGLSDGDYERMYEASMFRDEGMAKIIANHLQRQAGTSRTDPQAVQKTGPIVSYMGGGHVQYRLPVPNRVLRRSGVAKQTTIYLTSFEPTRSDEIRVLMQDAVADYIWLTPLSAQGPPRRCK